MASKITRTISKPQYLQHVFIRGFGHGKNDDSAGLLPPAIIDDTRKNVPTYENFL